MSFERAKLSSWTNKNTSMSQDERKLKNYVSESNRLDYETNIQPYNGQMQMFTNEYSKLLSNAMSSGLSALGNKTDTASFDSAYRKAKTDLDTKMADLNSRMTDYYNNLDVTNPYYSSLSQEAKSTTEKLNNSYLSSFRKQWNEARNELKSYEKEQLGSYYTDRVWNYKTDDEGNIVTDANGKAERTYNNDYDTYIATADPSTLTESQKAYQQFLTAENNESALAALDAWEESLGGTDAELLESERRKAQARLDEAEQDWNTYKDYIDRPESDYYQQAVAAKEAYDAAKTAYDNVDSDYNQQVASAKTKIEEYRANIKGAQELNALSDEAYDIITEIADRKSSWTKENADADMSVGWENLEAAQAMEQAIANTITDEEREKLHKEGLTDQEIELLVETRMLQVDESYMAEYQQKKAQYAAEHPRAASALSVGTNIISGVGYIDMLGQKVDNWLSGSNTPINYNVLANSYSVATSTIRGQVASDIENSKKWWGGSASSFLYQTGMSMVDSGLNAALAGAMGAVGIPAASSLSTAIMASSATTSATLAAHERGLTDGQALTLGIVAGTAEYITEKVSLEALLKKVNLVGVTNAGKAAAAITNYVCHNVLTEGSEEIASEVINIVADSIVAKDAAEWKVEAQKYKAENGGTIEEAYQHVLGTQIWESFVSGAISGGVMGGISGAVQGVSNNVLQNRINVANAIINGDAAIMDSGRDVDILKTQLANITDTESAEYKAKQAELDAALNVQSKAKGNNAVAQAYDNINDVISEYPGENASDNELQDWQNRYKNAQKQLNRALADYKESNPKAYNTAVKWVAEAKKNKKASDAAEKAESKSQKAVSKVLQQSGMEALSNVAKTTAAQTATNTEATVSTAVSAENESYSTEGYDKDFSAKMKSLASEYEKNGTLTEHTCKDVLGPNGSAVRSEIGITQEMLSGKSKSQKYDVVRQAVADKITQSKETVIAPQRAKAEAFAKEAAAKAEEARRASLTPRQRASEDLRKTISLEDFTETYKREHKDATDAEIKEAYENYIEDKAMQAVKALVEYKTKDGTAYKELTYAEFRDALENRLKKEGLNYTEEQYRQAFEKLAENYEEQLAKDIEQRKAKFDKVAESLNARLSGFNTTVEISFDKSLFEAGDDYINADIRVENGKRIIRFNGFRVTKESTIYSTVGHELFHPAAKVKIGDKTVLKTAIDSLQNLNKKGALIGYTMSKTTLMPGRSVSELLSKYDDTVKTYQNVYQEVYDAQAKANSTDEKEVKPRICSTEEAEEEFICDIMNVIFARNETKFAQQMTGVSPRFTTWLSDFLTRMQMTHEGRDLDDDVDRILNDLMDTWESALQKTVDSQAAEQEETGKIELVDGSAVETDKSITSASNSAWLDILYDITSGELTYVRDGKPLEGEVTADHIKKSTMGAMITVAVKLGNITKNEAEEQYQLCADIFNMIKATNMPDAVWAMVGSQMFSAVRTNADHQYSRTVDFTTVCKKTQEMITAVSEAMKQKKRGLTKKEITEIQKDVYEAGMDVPCPVCYVFSRWAGIGTTIDNMYKWQQEYDNCTEEELTALRELIADSKTKVAENSDTTETTENSEDEEDAELEIKAKKLTDEEKKKYRDLLRENGHLPEVLAEDNLTKAELKKLMQETDTEYADLLARLEHTQDIRKKSIKLKKKRGASEGEIKRAESAYLAEEMSLKFQIKQIEDNGAKIISWLTRVRLAADYKAVPADILFDLDAGHTLAKNYAAAWRYRMTRGAGLGKAIVPYSDFRFGDIIKGPGSNSALKQKVIKKPQDNIYDAKGNLLTKEEQKNIFKTQKEIKVYDADGTPVLVPGNSDFIGTKGSRNINKETGAVEFTKKQLGSVDSALGKLAAQCLIGGYRWQSTSDFRYDYALDYFMGFLEMQALGGKIQTYTKVAEYAEMIGMIGGDCNMSVMPLENGLDENGELQYSSVTGLSYDIAHELAEQYNNLQLILVGINDAHIKEALNDSRSGKNVGFIIPYHSSGASIEDFISALVANLGESFTTSNYSDYQKLQNDVEFSKKVAPKVKETLDSIGYTQCNTRSSARGILLTNTRALNEDELRSIFDENGNYIKSKDITNESYESLLEIERRALNGDGDAMREYLSWSQGILSDLYQRYENNTEGYCYKTTKGVVKRVELTKSQAEHIMPHEYWNKATTRGKTIETNNAYVNGFIFRSYCTSLGLVPRFTGWTKEGRFAYGDFSGQTLKDGESADFGRGYWKLLIDRPMYNSSATGDGRYREQQKIDVTSLNAGMLKYDENGKYANRTDYHNAIPDTKKAKEVGKAYAEKLTARENAAQEEQKNFSITMATDESGKTDDMMANFVSFFTGGRTLDVKLEDSIGKYLNEIAVAEIDEEIAKAAALNAGGDILGLGKSVNVDDFEKLYGKEVADKGVWAFHASPSCCSFSGLTHLYERYLHNPESLSEKQRGKIKADETTAHSTAAFIEKHQPQVFTLENVAAYRKSPFFSEIRNALVDNGYTFRIGFYNAKDFGAAANRRRMFLVATKAGGVIPGTEQYKSESKGWYSTLENDIGTDMIPQIPSLSDRMVEFLANAGIDVNNPGDWIFINGKEQFKRFSYSYGSSAAPTIVASSTSYRIISPDGKFYKATPDAVKLLMGLPRDMVLPAKEELAYRILGNGISGELTDSIVAPMIMENLINEKPDTYFLEQVNQLYLDAVERNDMTTAKELFYAYVLNSAPADITPILYAKPYASRGQTHDNVIAMKEVGKKIIPDSEYNAMTESEREDFTTQAKYDAGMTAIKTAAAEMAPLVPDNAVLIPVPGHNGIATYTRALAREIGRKTKSPVRNVMKAASRDSLYTMTQEGISRDELSLNDMGVYQNTNIPEGKIPVFIDNDITTGKTAAANVRAIGKGVVLSYTKVNRGGRYQSKEFNMKSAEVVTYDNQGNVIPLDDRFKTDRTGDEEWKNSDTRYSITGQNAKLSKAEKDNLIIAESMESIGMNPENIRFATGWFRGYDKKWRYEIDDSGAKIDYRYFRDVTDETKIDEHLIELAEIDVDNADIAFDMALENFNKLAEAGYTANTKEVKVAQKVLDDAEKVKNDAYQKLYRSQKGYVFLSDILTHKKLFKVYPQLRNVKVVIDNGITKKGAAGFAYTNTNTIVLAAKYSESQMLGIIMHEVQHMIQEIEGFASGANSDFWQENGWRLNADLKKIEKELVDIIDSAHSMEFSGDENDSPGHILDNYSVFYPATDGDEADILQDLEDFAKENGFYHILREYAAKYDELQDAKIRAERPVNGKDLYYRTAGEIEARDVSKRLNLTEADRRITQLDIYRPDVVFVEDVESPSGVSRDTALQAYDTASAEVKNSVTLGPLSPASQNNPPATITYRSLNNRYYDAVGKDKQTLINDYIQRYGEIAQTGRDNARDVHLPQQVGKGKNLANVSKSAVTIASAAAIADEHIHTIEDLVVDGRASYFSIDNKTLERNAEQHVKEVGFDSAVDEFIRAAYEDKVTDNLIALGAVLMNGYSNSGKPNAVKLADLMTAYIHMSHNSAVGLQAQNIFKKLTPSGELYVIAKDLEQMQKGHRYDLNQNLMVESWMTEVGDLLAKSISTKLGGSDAKAATVAQTILSDLKRFASDSLPKKNPNMRRRTQMDRIQDLFDNYSKYTEAWNQAKRALIEEYDIGGISFEDDVSETEIGDLLNTFMNDALDISERLTMEFTDKAGLKIPTELANKYLAAETDNDRADVLEEIYEALSVQMADGLKFSDKLKSYRYLAMLGNFKTQLRNVVGNAGFKYTRMIKESLAGVIEAALPMENRTTSALRDKATLHDADARRTCNECMDLIMAGGKMRDKTNKTMTAEGIERHMVDKRFGNTKSFKKTPFKWLLNNWNRITDKAMGEGFDVGRLTFFGDEKFCRAAFMDSLSRTMHANKTTWSEANESLKQKAIERAVIEAARATYRDVNQFSEAVAALRFKNPDTTVKKAINALGEGIMPFKKTPANILVRAIEYSPVNLVNAAIQTGVYQFGGAVNEDGSVKYTANDVVDTWASGITGTGLMLLGYGLASGILKAFGIALHGRKDDDDPLAAFETVEGIQEYSIEIGGKTYTLDWLAPECIPLLLGATMYELRSDGDMSGKDFLTVLNTISDPLLEMSMLQGINDALESANDYSGNGALLAFTANALWSAVTQFVPTIVGQAERAFNNIRQSTYVDKNKALPTTYQRALGKLSAKVPGWDYAQINYTDAWGRTQLNQDSATANALYQFLAPWYSTTIQESDMERKLVELYEATGDADCLIEAAGKYFNVYTDEDKDKVEVKNLTGAEYVTYNTTRGQTAYKAVTEFTESDAWNNLTNEQRVSVIKGIYSYATDVGKLAVTETASVGKTVEKVQDAIDSGLSIYDYYVSQAVTDDIEPWKDSNNETITNSQDLQQMQAIYAAYPNASKSEYQALFNAVGVSKSMWGYSSAMVNSKISAMERYGSLSVAGATGIDSVDKEIERLSNAGYDSGVQLSASSSKISVSSDPTAQNASNDISYEMSSTEYEKYDTTRRTTHSDMMSELVSSSLYNSLSDEEKASAVGQVNSYANAAAAVSVSSNYVPDSTYKKVQTAQESGIDATTYFVAYAAKNSIETKLVDEDGDTVSNSQNLYRMRNIYNTVTGLSQQEYYALFDLLGIGKTVKGYTQAEVENAIAKLERQYGAYN